VQAPEPKKTTAVEPSKPEEKKKPEKELVKDMGMIEDFNFSASKNDSSLSMQDSTLGKSQSSLDIIDLTLKYARPIFNKN